MLASINTAIMENSMILDTAASQSLFKNKSLVRGVHNTESVFIDGVNSEGEAITATSAGYSKFGKVLLSDKSIGNILSFGGLKILLPWNISGGCKTTTLA